MARLILPKKIWELLTEVIILFGLLKHAHGNGNKNITNIITCVLPSHPRFGHWAPYSPLSSSTSPGDAVPVGTILEVSCSDSYKVEGSTSIACIRGEWVPGMGKCLRTCVSLTNTTTTSVTCAYKGQILSNCINVVDGASAHFQCAPFYEIGAVNKYPLRRCSNGQWRGGLPECVPVCGVKGITKDPTLIVGGSNTTSLDYPWQVALYEKNTKILICGGSLLNEKTILTAAHCITNERGKLQPKDLYTVAVGKTYRNYNDSRDITAQFSSIEQMYIPRQYKAHIQRYFGDIAIIITNTTFLLSVNVQPICVVWNKKFHQSLESPSKGNNSYVSGWGFTVEHTNPSDVLKTLRVPLITNDECERKLSEEDLEYLTDDKLCAGFSESGMSVCKGDSGGGLVSKYGDRHYIIGVVSIAPQSSSALGGCDSQQYSLYTRFSYYLEDFVIDIEARFRPYENFECIDCFVSSTTSRGVGCLLPDHPRFGNWSVYGMSSADLVPGDLVEPGTTLNVECETNYTVKSNSSVVCEEDQWSSVIGQCFVSTNITIQADDLSRVDVVTNTDIHPNCTDNRFYANCALIVREKYCYHKYYARFCCNSCTKAGLLSVNSTLMLNIHENIEYDMNRV